MTRDEFRKLVHTYAAAAVRANEQPILGLALIAKRTALLAAFDAQAAALSGAEAHLEASQKWGEQEQVNRRATESALSAMTEEADEAAKEVRRLQTVIAATTRAMDQIGVERDEAEARGRAKGIEEAAKVADWFAHQYVAHEVQDGIRALLPAAPSTKEGEP